MSIAQQNEIEELKRRVAALEKRLPAATTQELCDQLETKLQEDRSRPLEKRKSA